MLVKMRKNERCSWNAAKYIALFLVLLWFDFNDDDYDRMIHIKRLSLWLGTSVFPVLFRFIAITFQPDTTIRQDIVQHVSLFERTHIPAPPPPDWHYSVHLSILHLSSVADLAARDSYFHWVEIFVPRSLSICSGLSKPEYLLYFDKLW